MLKHRFLPEIAKEPHFFGGGGGDSDITSRVEPWSGAIGYYADLYLAGKDAFDTVSKDPYPGFYFSGENAYDLLARDAVGFAITGMGSDADKIRNHAERLLAGEYLGPDDNPWLAGAVSSSLDQLKLKLTDEILPAILDASIQGGAYSGTAHIALTLKALEGFDREGAKMAASIYYENYVRERQLQENAPQLLVVAETINAKVAALWQTNADQFRGLQQIALDEALRHFEDTLTAPWRGLAEFSAVLTGGGFNTSTRNDPSKEQNRFAQLFQGTLGGAVTGFQVGGPVGGAIGGLLGGIGGLFM